MNFEIVLKNFKKEVDREIEVYFTRAIKEAQKIDLVTANGLKHVKKIIMAGGKRIRPALMFYGYLAAGGKEKEKMLKTSISIELIHIFLLIHDDIIDCEKKRHGIKTINAKYEEIGKKLPFCKNFKHFGDSMAIVLGDAIGSFGGQVIFNSGFEPRLIVQALYHLQSIISLTVVGQVQDIYIEYLGKAQEKEVLKMYENKTAKYTMEGPLHLGAILGGGNEELFNKLSKYAIPVGIAFQIQDDILGIFGSEKKIGKSVGSDIQEGKQTILVIKAREKANKIQQKILSDVLGKKNLNEEDKRNFKKIIIETGSLDYAQRMAQNLILSGKKELDNLKITKEAKHFLSSMADYMINRKL